MNRSHAEAPTRATPPVEVDASPRDSGDPASRFRRVREATDRLVAPLSDEDLAVQIRTEASPAKWHLAHTTWFFETFLLEPYEPGFAPFHEDFRVLFNSYYNTVGAQHPRHLRGALTRPSARCVREYRRATDERVLALLASCRDEDRAEIARVLEIGLHHEQQHQELILTDLKLLLAANPLFPAYVDYVPTLATAPPDADHDPSFLPHEGGPAKVGHDPTPTPTPGAAAGAAAFAYDNESPRHTVWLEPFALADRLVTNAEFRAFIDDGAYHRPELWLSDGYAAAQREGWTAPMYWVERDGATQEFTLGGLVPLDPRAPVCHISFYEADAFARWRALDDARVRLPTEFELERAAETRPGAFDDPRACVLDTPGVHPPADARPDNGAHDLRQCVGACWQWTGSAYRPYPGYRPPAGALGEYNGKFMVNQHVLRGGSVATPPGHTRHTYRNFFHPESRWQFAGLRLARDDR